MHSWSRRELLIQSPGLRLTSSQTTGCVSGRRFRVLRYTPGMVDTEPVADPATVRLFIAVLVCEALTILALWAFGRYFS